MTTISVFIQNIAGPMGKVLIGKNADGTWSFPSGVQRTNEPAADACERIAWECLGIKVKAGKLAMLGHKMPHDGHTEHIACGNITHNTDTKCNYHAYYEAVNTWQAQPETGSFTELCWVHPSELVNYTFAGDDANFMARYAPWISGQQIPDVKMY